MAKLLIESGLVLFMAIVTGFSTARSGWSFLASLVASLFAGGMVAAILAGG